MTSIDTLDKMIEHRHWLSVHCNARDCWNRAPVDLPALAARLGGDHLCLAQDLRRYFICGQCGSRDVGFTTGLETPNAFAGAYTATALPTIGDIAGKRRHRRARKHGARI